MIIKKEINGSEIEIDVDLGDFDDSDIKDEYEERFGLESEKEISEFSSQEIYDQYHETFGSSDCTEYRKIYNAIVQGRKDDAISMMHDYLRDELGKTL